jgi:RHS repeat-associated protein
MHPTAIRTLGLALALASLTPVHVMAQDDPRATPDFTPWIDEEIAPTSDAPEEGSAPIEAEVYAEALREGLISEAELPEDVREAARARLASEIPGEGTPVSLPTGGPRSAATPQALPLPSGEGSIEGMGESFSASLSSGALSFTLPIAVPAGRHGVTPSVSIGYSSGGGSSELGFGWGLGVAAIARQTDRGLPRYDDRAAWHPGEDRFVYAGSHELVPVDSGGMAVLDGGLVPAELTGWQEYRAHVEGVFMRFFRAPDATRWVVQSPDGSRYELGNIPRTEGALPSDWDSVVMSPEGHIASWGLVRTSDAHGSTIRYVYAQHDGERYLSDIYYISPASCGSGSVSDRRRCSAPLSEYGARVHFVYEDRPDPTLSYRSGWRTRMAWRLRRIEVTAAGETVGSRALVRRYHFGYDTRAYHSLLTSITVEGRPETLDAATGAVVGDGTLPESLLGDGLVGPTLPPMRFTYTGDVAGGVDGFPRLDGTRRRGAGGPLDGAGDPRADLYDVNSDGLVDLVVTDPARFRTEEGGPAAGVYFNGFAGADATPAEAGTFSSPISVGVPAAMADAMQLTNRNLVPMDVDGDGRSDLLHMPRASSYGFFTPVRARTPAVSPAAQGWEFAYLPVDLEGADPRIDFTRDGDRTRVLDVNADGLVDVVRTSGTAIETWLNLGWYPGGEGHFGSATERADGTWLLSTMPLESCLPAAGAPVSFDDPEIRLADLNGDGLEDIVRLSSGSVLYWPGLGYGRFGEACAPGVTRANPIDMRAPRDLGPDFTTTYFADIDGDGMSDIARLGDDVLEVWFNMGGVAFSQRATVEGLRWSRDLERVVRFVDVDGSGTTDVLFARARAWEWVDPMGGRRPRMLLGVQNGLGATTAFTYGSSATDYLRDLAAAHACTTPDCEVFRWAGRDDGLCDQSTTEAAGHCVVRASGAPMVSTLVRSTESSDHLDALGAIAHVSRTEYAYHEAYYEGIEQEVRGFGATDVRSIGGGAIGTSITRSYMHQGRRPSSIAADRLANNPWESLAGSTYLTETWDETSGRYLHQTHTGFRIHRLATGLDGREIAWAFGARTDEVRYDLTTAWTPAASGTRVPFYASPGSSGGATDYPAVDRYLVTASGGVSADPTYGGWTDTIRRRSTGYYAVLASTTDQVDHVGHVLQSTAWGRVRGEGGEPRRVPEDVVSHTVVALLEPREWYFASTEAWVTGHGSSERLSWTTNTYAGVDLVQVNTHVAIPRAYDFAGDADGSEGFTQVAEDLVSSTTYDVWGNALATCAGAPVGTDSSSCLRHATVAYDPAYQHLPISERLSVEAGRELVWSAESDRGLGAPRRSTDPRGAVSEVGLDGFGRPTYARAPNVRGCEGSTMPTSRISYRITTNPVAQPLSVFEATSFRDCHDPTDVGVARSYVDGLGRTRATLARADAPHAWVRSGLTEFTPRGQVYTTAGSAFIDAAEPSFSSVLTPLGEELAYTGYDAFGRPHWTQPLGAVWYERSWYLFGALVDITCDPYDYWAPTHHVGAQTCTIVRRDGQGRVDETILNQRREIGAPIEVIRLWPSYRADGALVRLERVATPDRSPRYYYTGYPLTQHVERTFALDSVGRRLASTDADTDARRPGSTVANRSWRYLYNRLGDLVAVRDPRGCGQNFYYDRAGRLVGEDYVSCGEAELWRDFSTETVPAGSLAMNLIAGPRSVEVRTYYDLYPGWVTGELLPPVDTADSNGLVTATVDRGARSVVGYDPRGTGFWTARQVAMLPEAPDAPRSLSATLPVTAPSGAVVRSARRFDENHTYTTSSLVDHAGRPVSVSLPPTDAGALVEGRLSYGRRGLPSSVTVDVDGYVTQTILASARYARDGLVEELVWGDSAGGTRAPTRTSMLYDHRRRPARLTTLRTRTASLTSDRPLGAVSVVADQLFTFDSVDNLLNVEDRRLATEWPAGFRPQSVALRYDALWHVVAADYSYANDAASGTDTATDYRTVMRALEGVEPMHELPAESVSPLAADRVMSLTWDYDFLGNTTEWTDDAHAFYERSLDRITNGVTEAGGRPSTLRLATSISGPGSTTTYAPSVDRGGWVEVDYGDSGNVSAVTVHGTCHDASVTQLCRDPGGALESRRTALRTVCRCDVEQHYAYRFDELNQIIDARRYDRGGSGDWVIAAQLRYGFDGSQQRTVKEVRDTLGATRYAIWPLPGDYERRGMIRTLDGYETTLGSESSHLVGGARVVWREGEHAPGLGLDGEHRITLPIGDLLGTASAVVDLVSGELVEASTYYPNGARETIRTSDAEIPLEPYGFTGKEADEEVGLTYFGMRFLIPRLGRWATPDPLQIHAEGGGEAMNSYHYISGSLLQATDPIGLDEGEVSEPSDEDLEWADVLREQASAEELYPDYYRFDGVNPPTRDSLTAGSSARAARSPRVAPGAVDSWTEPFRLFSLPFDFALQGAGKADTYHNAFQAVDSYIDARPQASADTISALEDAFGRRFVIPPPRAGVARRALRSAGEVLGPASWFNDALTLWRNPSDWNARLDVAIDAGEIATRFAPALARFSPHVAAVSVGKTAGYDLIGNQVVVPLLDMDARRYGYSSNAEAGGEFWSMMLDHGWGGAASTTWEFTKFNVRRGFETSPVGRLVGAVF